MIALLLLPLAFAADVRSPHGAPESCTLCHEAVPKGTPPEQIVFQGGSPDAACLQCHESDPHEVGLEPGRAEVPEDMLLVGGKLACLSCHDEPACDGQERGTYHFRGGPYPSVGALCARCHQVTGTERFDPHQAMNLAPDDPTTCEHCHQEAPAPDATGADLKVDGPNICLGCHVEATHAGSRSHLGPPPPSMVAAVQASGLPLAREAIVCLTCHDPHPGASLTRSADLAKGVGRPLFPQRWLDTVLAPALEARGDLVPKTVEPDFLRKPLLGGELCGSCHSASATEALREERR
jgi:predicted CXXCH cytochrome family protein